MMRAQIWMFSPPGERNCPCTSAASDCDPRKPLVWQGIGPHGRTLSPHSGTDIPGLLQECCTRQGCNDSGRAASCPVWAPLCNFDAPPWQQLAANSRPSEVAVRNFGGPLRGWQRAATACLDAAACESLLSELDMASRALLLSQAGLGGSRAIKALPTSPELRLPSERMRVLLLRRLRMPLPHAPRRCRCGGMLDVFGDHRAACPVAGVLGPRGAPGRRRPCRDKCFPTRHEH